MEETEIRRRKLSFRASHRGFRELDMLMEAFAAAHLATFTPRQLDEFEQVLDLPDQDVYAWIIGTKSPPDAVRSEVLDLVLGFRYSAPFNG